MSVAKRIVGIVFAVLVLASCFTANAAVSDFTDVPEDSWYAEFVDFVYERDLMTGTSAHRFSPQLKITRAMFAQILYRLAGSPVVNEPGDFVDVPGSSWYSDACLWAAESNIMSGYGENKFGPGDFITREQMMVVLNRFIGDNKNNGDLSLFKDREQVSPWALASVSWGVGNGLMVGSNGFLNPRAGATRAEAAAILTRFCTTLYDLDDENEASESYIDISTVQKGFASVSYVGQTDKKLRVKVACGDESTIYVIEPGKKYRVCFPYGPGDYEIGLYANTTGIKYRRLLQENVSVNETAYRMSLVCPSSYYDYDSVSGIEIQARKVWDSSKTDRENAKTVFDWVASNMEYDMDRVDTVSTGYLPDLSHALENKGGLCLDYAAVYASMLRSQGVPCQIIVGYEGAGDEKQCHAWCRAYLDNKWVYVDPAFGSGLHSVMDRFFDMSGTILAHYETDYMF